MIHEINRISNKIKSAEVLYDSNQFLDAITIYWQATRDSIFYFLHFRKVSFHSTNEALREILKIVEKDIGILIVQTEIIATLSEWDEFFTVNNSQAAEFKENCKIIINTLSNGQQGL